MIEPPLKSNKLGDWLEWLETLNPAKIELGLDCIRQVYERLPSISNATKVITVAGTNGKGSCVTALQAGALAANKSVIAFTSPHLLAYNERIQMQGCPVADDLLVEAFQQIALAQQGVFITYFEYATLAALCIAAQHKPELLILEVGLGGRLDSVNLIDADLVVLTKIGMDHTEWLGDNLESIAYEKCGVIKEGAYLVVAARNMPEIVNVTAIKKSAKLLSLGTDFDISKKTDGAFCLEINNQSFDIGELNLHEWSVAGACMALSVFWPKAMQKISQAMQSISMLGRYQQTVIEDRQVIFDVAHNPMAIEHLVDRLQSEGISSVDILFAMMSDKDYEKVIELLAPVVRRWYLLELDQPRALCPDLLSEILVKKDISNYCRLDDGESNNFMQVFTEENHQIPLLVTGSFYTVSAVMQASKIC